MTKRKDFTLQDLQDGGDSKSWGTPRMVIKQPALSLHMELSRLMPPYAIRTGREGSSI